MNILSQYGIETGKVINVMNDYKLIGELKQKSRKLEYPIIEIDGEVVGTLEQLQEYTKKFEERRQIKLEEETIEESSEDEININNKKVSEGTFKSQDKLVIEEIVPIIEKKDSSSEIVSNEVHVESEEDKKKKEIISQVIESKVESVEKKKVEISKTVSGKKKISLKKKKKSKNCKKLNQNKNFRSYFLSSACSREHLQKHSIWNFLIVQKRNQKRRNPKISDHPSL